MTHDLRLAIDDTLKRLRRGLEVACGLSATAETASVEGSAHKRRHDHSAESDEGFARHRSAARCSSGSPPDPPETSR